MTCSLFLYDDILYSVRKKNTIVDMVNQINNENDSISDNTDQSKDE